MDQGRVTVGFSDTAEFEDVSCIDDSPLAIQVVIDGQCVWIPRSAVDESSEVQEKEDEGLLVISEWMAVEKGLI